MNETKKKSKRWVLPLILAICAALGVIAMELPAFLQARSFTVSPSVTVEAGQHYPWPYQFLEAEDPSRIDIFYAEDVSKVDTRIPGTYPLTLKVGEEIFQSQVVVEDTVAPTGSTKDLVLVYPATAEAAEFVAGTEDVTAVTVTFKEAPDFEKEGDQTVSILLTDLGGNETVLTAGLTMIFDVTPPTILGVKDITVYAGDTVAYRSGVTVEDDRDENPALTVDSSNVDLTAPGTYTVTYTATDYTGNSASVTSTVSVREKQPGYADIDVIYEAADKLLTQIIKEGMNTEEQVRAVAQWVRYNCIFTGASVKDDWLQGAYRMINTRQGDCFNYFALTKLLLERLEIPNIDVTKVKNHPDDSNHYWSLVSLDGGETYYHVDTTPRTDATLFILVTDSYMDNYSAKHRNCFNRDKSLYPATPASFSYTPSVG